MRSRIATHCGPNAWEKTILRKLSLLTVTAIAVLGLVGSASAAPLNWEGTSILRLGDFPEATILGGGVATINNSSGTLPGHLESIRVAASRGNVNTTFTQFVTDPETAGNQIKSIQYIGVEGGTGTFSPISGFLASTATTFNGVVPIRGLVKLCLFQTECTQFGAINLTTITGNGTQPIGIGIGGLLTATILNGFARLSIEAKPWQIKTGTVIDHITTPTNGNTTFIDITFMGFAHGPGSGTTSTADIGGVVQLVSPTQVRTDLPLGSNQKVGAGQRLFIRFIPEPGMLLLIGSGVAGLALLGRRRMR
jgi:hypothetical protein